MDNQTKEMTFKERILKIYDDLNNIDIDSLNDEINELKKELETIIKKCDESDKEKEMTLLSEIEQESIHVPIPVRHKENVPCKVIEPPSLREEKLTLKDFLSFAFLTVIIALLIFIIVILV